MIKKIIYLPLMFAALNNGLINAHPLVICDFEGTLANSVPTLFTVYNELAAEFSLSPLSDQDISELRSVFACEALSRLGLPFYRMPSFINLMRHVFAQKIFSCPLVDGMREALQTLKNKGYTLALISLQSEDVLKRYLAEKDFLIFDIVHSGTVFNFWSRSALINGVLKKSNKQAEDTFLIVDELTDITTARRTKVKVIAVSWGYNSYESLEAEHPHFLINDPSDLVSVIESEQSKQGQRV